jgi:signal transduction histidine kinase
MSFTNIHYAGENTALISETYKETIENEEKNSYNYMVKENKIIDEIPMGNGLNQFESDARFMSHEQFEMIVKSMQLLNANVKKDDVLNNIVNVAINLTNADRGTLYLVEKETKEIWSKVLVSDNVKEIRLKIGEGIAGWVAENGELLNIEDVSKDKRFDPSFDKATGFKTKSMLVYPIKNKTNETVGVLQLLNSVKGRFSEQDEVFLNAISLNAALALENASLVEQLVHSERDTSLGKMGNFLTYDLRKPILVCKRYAEHLLKKELDFDVRQVVKMLDEQLDQVANQISAASDFTEGTTLLRKQKVNLNDTLYDFAGRMRSFVKSYNCKIEHELGEDAKVNVDIKEFYQCYHNIIKNSCEALHDGGNILVSTNLRDKNVEIAFNDKGIGIESQDIRFVFDPLWTKNKKNNSGLGLSIAKKIVGDHEGKIWIESNEETGTTLFIHLPVH